MILNRENKNHWQLILVSKLEADILLRTGTLLLILNHQAPAINPSDLYIMDIMNVTDIDILGTCGLKSNAKLVSTLKHNCLTILNGAEPPVYWQKLLHSFSSTNAL